MTEAEQTLALEVLRANFTSEPDERRSVKLQADEGCLKVKYSYWTLRGNWSMAVEIDVFPDSEFVVTGLASPNFRDLFAHLRSLKLMEADFQRLELSQH